MKHKALTALLLVSALTLSVLIPSAFAAPSASTPGTTVQETQKVQRQSKRGGEKVAEPENAIGKDAAKAKAFADAGVTAEQTAKVKVHVSQLDDGTVIYKVCFTSDGTCYTYQINAVSGAVVDKNSKAATEKAPTESRGHAKKSDSKKVAEPENAIGKDAAKAKAFADAGVTAEQAAKVKVHVSQLDDGTVIYKVSFTSDGTCYTYQINAVSGAVVDKNSKAATEKAPTESRGHAKKSDSKKVAEPENAIGKDAAKAKAFADAGVTAEQAAKVKVHVSQLDDGTVIYKVCFTSDGTCYTYQINAVSGAVVDKNSKAATEKPATESRVRAKKSGKSAGTVTETASPFV